VNLLRDKAIVTLKDHFIDFLYHTHLRVNFFYGIIRF
jgi:hypothetical protein